MKRSKKRSLLPIPGGNKTIIAAVAVLAIVVALCLWHPWSANPDVKETGGDPTSVATEAPDTEPTEVPTDLPADAPTEEPAQTPGPQKPDPVDLTGATLPEAAEGYLPVCDKGQMEKKQIAITIDDLWQAENVKELLTLCEQHGAKLTFFPIGEAVANQKDLLKQIHDAGHEIENHTYNHVNLYGLSSQDMTSQLLQQNALVNEALGVDYRMHFLRPRGGNADFDKRMHNMLKQMDYVGVAHWNVSGTPELSSWASDLKSGDIILFHTTDGDMTKLRKLIPKLVEVGYELVTLNELYGLPANETYPLGTTTIAKADTLDYAAMEADIPYSLLKNGDCSFAVQRLQARLKELGYYAGECDGDYGTGTKDSVTLFQKTLGIKEDGIAGTETQNALFSANAIVYRPTA